MTAPQPLSFWVRTLDTLLQDEFAQAAEDAGLDPGQWQVLTRLRLGGVAEDVLREGLAPFLTADNSLDALVDGAMSDGLVEHQANEYRLTSRGLERVAEIEDKTLGDLQARAFTDLSQEEQDSLLSSLERVATNLGWQPA
jgi:DNA-binding MarR family transcriptional regulator